MVMTTPDRREGVDLDAVFGALSNPTRRGLVQRLTVADATISELAAPLTMTLPAVSKHLRVLERAGLVSRRREGKAQRCRLHPEILDAAEGWLAERRSFWEGSLQSLASHFDTEAAPEESGTADAPDAATAGNEPATPKDSGTINGAGAER